MKPYYLIFLFIVTFSCTKIEKNLTKITAKNIAIDSTIVASPEIERMVAPYKEKLTSEMERVLSFTPIDLSKKSSSMQSTLGNLMADLSLEIANPLFTALTNQTIDFAMFNNGGLRATISKGTITKEHAFKLMPFDNELVVVVLTGDKIKELITYFISNKTAHPLSKNIALTINNEAYQLKINGSPFDENKTYTVLTSDYLQGGGDRMDFFKNPKKLIPLNYKVRDAIIDYFEKVDTIKIAIDNRVILQ